MSFAASWYALARSSDIGFQPKRLVRFGERWVAFRDRDGKPAVMGESCPHFGASLSQGHVDGDGCLVCPFHRWRFDSNGACVAIPGSDVIPATAHRAPLVTVERYGLLWAWWGSAEPQFALPNFPDFDDQRSRSVLDFSIKTSLPLVLANSYDVRHLVETHRTPAIARSRTQLEMGSAFERRGIDAEAWCGSELSLELSKLTLKETLRLVFEEGSPIGFLTTLSGYMGTWAMTQWAGMKSLRTEVNGWPTGHYVRVYIDGKYTNALLTTGCPVDEKECLVLSVTRQAESRGQVGDWLTTRFSNLQVQQAAATDAVILNELEPRAGGVYVREDRAILEYLRLHDRFAARVDPAWLSAREGRRAGGERRSLLRKGAARKANAPEPS